MINQPPFKKAMRSSLSFILAIPEKAMALPGEKLAGDFSHLLRLLSVHFRVALEDNDELYNKY